ncbi:hypothetical protein C7974DRAFT_305943 [Boeremia exigua]|uniref:uncharacterized protein n=1 Tax=Boeremia exigua TaxID=749465 RepID=UPI001E8EE12E|nr:uncharacterized protein C7974DRAFT_305943 [Boeremia exigua]KAH6639115.1 hypothetical protein C7974DRAFT_305943 [Boeremia exigua]
MPHCGTQYNEWYPQYGASTTYETIGVDIEPAQMAGIYYQDILPRITADLASVSIEAYQPSLWSDYMTQGLQRNMNYDHTSSKTTPLRNWIFPPPMSNIEDRWGSRFFLAGIPSNTTTGILREHAMRFNSSVSRSKIERALFPTSCSGEEPFIASFEMKDDISARICVPGKLGVFPWTTSRNRQDIVEELYLDMWGTYKYRAADSDGDDTNVTVHCEVKTTRGYFELGNLSNNGTYGSLLQDWPDADVMARDFNDLVSDDKTAFVPTESDDFVGDSLRPNVSHNLGIPSMYWKASGPLTLSAVALFGNISWFNNVSKYSANKTHDSTTASGDQSSWYRMCAGMPFSTLSGLYGARWYFHAAGSCQSSLENQMFFGSTNQYDSLLKLRYQWLKQFAPPTRSNDTGRLEALLQISASVTNQALLNHYAPTVDHTLLGGGDFRGRKVYTSPGYPVLKPDVSVAVLSVMAILIGLQLLGLLCLAWYIYLVPSWTVSLDAMAVAHIGARLGQQDLLLTGVSGDRDRDARALQKVDGLIDVVNVEEGDYESDTELQQLSRPSSLEVDSHSRSRLQS